MQVSTVSINSSKTVFNTRASNRTSDNSQEASFNNYIRSYSKNINKVNTSNRLFDCMNEWKNFCHAQIEKGNFDVVV